MKLSVKLLSGLALMALIAVAGVGLSHSASANADAKIYITNAASGLTNEVSPPSDGSGLAPTTRSTASTVYGTYADDAVRDIVTNSDHFVVTVVDQDLNTAPNVYSHAEGAANGYVFSDAADANFGSDGLIVVTDDAVNAAGLNEIGDQFRLVLTGVAPNANAPIVGSVSDIKIVSAADQDVEVSGLTVSEIFSAGDGASPGIITVNVTGPVNIGLDANSDGVLDDYTGLIQVKYPTSAVNTATAIVKSVVDDRDAPNAIEVALVETGRNTGRFEGYIQVFKRTDGTPNGADSANSGQTLADAATVAAIGGPITVTYTDQDGVTHSVSATLDITTPSATITAPLTGSETQNRLPVFTGNVSDNQSGIRVSTFGLYIDKTGVLATQIIADDGTPAANTLAQEAPAGATDGDKTMSFSHTPAAVIPTGQLNPDHEIDFQVRVADLAGNYGYSDSDTSDGNAEGVLNNKWHTITIDQIIPQMQSAVTGLGYDTEDAAETTDVRDSIKVVFDGNVKSSSISPSDFKVTFSGAGGVFVPANVTVVGPAVYLDLDSTIPSDNEPTVALQGTIQDIAGNSTDAGSASADDGLKPVLTVTQSGGSGTGTGSEGPDKLTKDNMVITITSDEDLGGSPVVTVKIPGAGGNLLSSMAIPQGGNVWKLTVSGGADGARAVKVVGSDIPGNEREVGNLTDTAFNVDSAADEDEVLPDDTTQANPYITVDYSSDDSTLSVTSATLDGVDITSSVIASADNKKFFYQPTTPLTNGDHEFVIKVVDAAGNTDTAEHTVTKSSRTDFVIRLFAGWNAVSVPSNPLDDSIGSVFSNAGVKQVVAYDATTPAQPWRIASKVDGSFSSQTNPGLTSINTGHGYWVETSDFENQKVALQGPTGPGDARPGLTTIPTGNGWNFVGVVDQSRNQTQGGNEGVALTRPNGAGNVTYYSYLSTVNHGRVYTFDTVDSEFDVQDATDGGDNVLVGAGIWVYISPQQNGKLPHIVP